MECASRSHRAARVALCLAAAVALVGGCKSASGYREDADEVADEVILQKQKELKLEQPFTIETWGRKIRRQVMIDQGLPRSSDASLSSRDLKPIKGWPEKVEPRPSTQPSTRPTVSMAAPTTAPATQAARPAKPVMRITLIDALRIGAYNSRDYQQRKEQIFLDALRLDLVRNDFRTLFTGTAEGTLISDQAPPDAPNNGVVGTASLGVSRKLSNGANLASSLSVDVAKLLTNGKESSYGVSWDATVSIPLLRGAGEAVVLEPLRQAERNVAYDLLEFEQYKREFAVNVAQQYLQVLSQYDQIRNAYAGYQRSILSTRRARRQADAGRLPEIQVDQSLQQELRSRDRWIQAQANLGRRLDSLKLLLGLPPDAEVELDSSELRKLSARIEEMLAPAVEEVERESEIPPEPTTAPMPSASEWESVEVPPLDVTLGKIQLLYSEAIRLALKNRPDLLVANGEVFDAQRKVVVAASALQAGLELQGNAFAGGSRRSLSSAKSDDAPLKLNEGVYSTSLLVDLPFERTAERNEYRARLVDVQAAVRGLQGAEDNVKADVRGSLRDLQLAREQIKIQAKSVAVADKRVASTNLFMDAGRAQIRDVLEAQDALVTAQNGLTSALISYRVSELSLQRDMGVLEVNEQGLWREYEPVLAGREQVQ